MILRNVYFFLILAMRQLGSLTAIKIAYAIVAKIIIANKIVQAPETCSHDVVLLYPKYIASEPTPAHAIAQSKK